MIPCLSSAFLFLNVSTAVEYRLLQHAPFPAAVQDAAAVYAHILRKYKCLPELDEPEQSPPRRPFASSSPSSRLRPNGTYSAEPPGSSRFELLENSSVAHACMKKSCKVILIGDSAGGNLVLALARWIRDEAVLPPPDGLLLLSPSCDPCKYSGPFASTLILPPLRTQHTLSQNRPLPTFPARTNPPTTSSTRPSPAHCCSAPSWGTTRSR